MDGIQVIKCALNQVTRDIHTGANYKNGGV